MTGPHKEHRAPACLPSCLSSYRPAGQIRIHRRPRSEAILTQIRKLSPQIRNYRPRSDTTVPDPTPSPQIRKYTPRSETMLAWPSCLPATLPACPHAQVPAFHRACLPACLPSCRPAFRPACLPTFLLVCLPAGVTDPNLSKDQIRSYPDTDPKLSPQIRNYRPGSETIAPDPKL